MIVTHIKYLFDRMHEINVLGIGIALRAAKMDEWEKLRENH